MSGQKQNILGKCKKEIKTQSICPLKNLHTTAKKQKQLIVNYHNLEQQFYNLHINRI